jgi:hypothetical protein
VVLILAHVPANWIPVRRQEHAPLQKNPHTGLTTVKPGS